MDEVISFGDWIKQRRQALHLTQEALAQRLSVALGTLRKWESDERRPSQDLAMLLAEVLDVPLDARPTFVKVARGELALDHMALAPDPASLPRSALVRPQSNLPVQRAPLIGRARELVQVRALLLRGDVGLITLSGPGGTGKTRLALEVAAGMLPSFADGVWFVDLAPVGDPGLLASTIAGTLGLKETGELPLQEALTTYLQAKELLLVLDNFEQIVAAAPVLTALLSALPQLKVLVTSREVLHVSGEHEYPLAPLSLPDLKRLPAPDQLTQYAAVELFIQRGRAVRAEFQVTQQNAAAVAEICVRLDGLPLALELAAARLKLFSPEALLKRLDNRLTMLTSGARDRTARQQTLRGAIDWSYSLLRSSEQLLFARLGVFVGGRTFDAIEAVCNADGAVDVLVGVDSLVEKSLLKYGEGSAGEPRFSMLETIQEYARERLAESGEAEELRQRYAEYFRQVAEAAEAMALGQQHGAAMALVSAEQDNLRAALTWALERRQSETALWLAYALGLFLVDGSGKLTEARQWIEAALAMPQHAQAAGAASALRGKVLNQAAYFAQQTGDFGVARLRAEEGLTLSRARADTWDIAWSLHTLAMIAAAQGDDVTSRERNGEALALQRELGNPVQLAVMLNNVGWQAYLAGDDAQAVVLLEESVELLRHEGALVVSLESLGVVLIERGEHARARALLTEGLHLARDGGITSQIMCGLEGLAYLSAPAGIAQGAPVEGAQRAARLFGAAKAFRETGDELLLPAERSLHERHVAIGQAQLDEAAWQAAWAEGRAMTLEQAIAYALAETNPE